MHSKRVNQCHLIHVLKGVVPRVLTGFVPDTVLTSLVLYLTKSLSFLFSVSPSKAVLVLTSQSIRGLFESRCIGSSVSGLIYCHLNALRFARPQKYLQ